MKGIVITIIVFAVFAGFMLIMLGNAATTSEEELREALRSGILRAVVSCYAFEGFYPEDLAYLEEHYNLIIDRERFVVHYDKIADNLIPTIIVLNRNSGHIQGQGGSGGDSR